MSELAKAAKQTNARACYDCGKCTATCPLSLSGASYSPRRHVLAANLGNQQEIIDDKSLFACLTCGRCDSRCPAEVSYTELVRSLRAIAHSANVEPECPHGGSLQSVMRMMAKGGMQQNRLGWLDDELSTLSTTGEVFYWTGCAMYYDAFMPELEVSSLNGCRAALRLLNKLDITPVVSPDERCCGHDLLWNGDQANFEALARHNVKLVADSGARTIVVSCAECYRTWSVDYQAYMDGPGPRVLHISEFLQENLSQLSFAEQPKQTMTFHDPCRLGRHLGVYEPPRQVLAALPHVELKEMRRSRAHAVCCAGSTWSSCDRFVKQIQVERLREARATQSQLLVTACPKCQIHFRCAMRDPKLGEEISITMRDVAEVVADALGGGK